ncbi:MAG: 50S ribosomal protein L9 [Patescibacteria group bacterium]|jgi:large subunit ribosomal protein L9
MKVILLKSLPKVGNANAVVNVKSGYARNYLFPQNLAVPATEELVKNLDRKKEIFAVKGAEDIKTTEALAAKLSGVELIIAIKTSKEGGIFGSVTAAKIVTALKEKGFEVDKNYIDLDRPLKELGEHTIKIKLPHNLEAKVKLTVQSL